MKQDMAYMMTFVFFCIVIVALYAVEKQTECDTACDTECKVEQYQQCRIEQPDLGEYGCLMIVID
jgi:hypothetical protein